MELDTGGMPINKVIASIPHEKFVDYNELYEILNKKLKPLILIFRLFITFI
jgi:hypothetical protein